MERVMENVNCPLNGTRWCALLNAQSCKSCTIGGEGETPEMVIEDLKRYESLLPEEGIEKLTLSRRCTLCKGEAAGERAGWLLLDMAHPELRHLQTKIDGKQKKSPGTLITLQFAVCPRCRNRILGAELAPIVMPLLVSGLALIAVNLPPIHDALARIAGWMTLLVWAVATVLGILGGKLAARLMMKRAERETTVDILRHPTVRKMRENGWVPVERENGTLLAFSKSRRTAGLGTYGTGRSGNGEEE